jgi:hypothetical protein
VTARQVEAGADATLVDQRRLDLGKQISLKIIRLQSVGGAFIGAFTTLPTGLRRTLT